MFSIMLSHCMRKCSSLTHENCLSGFFGWVSFLQGLQLNQLTVVSHESQEHSGIVEPRLRKGKMMKEKVGPSSLDSVKLCKAASSCE